MKCSKVLVCDCQSTVYTAVTVCLPANFMLCISCCAVATALLTATALVGNGKLWPATESEPLNRLEKKLSQLRPCLYEEGTKLDIANLVSGLTIIIISPE